MYNNCDVTERHALRAYEREVEDFRLGSFKLVRANGISSTMGCAVEQKYSPELEFGRSGEKSGEKRKSMASIVYEPTRANTFELIGRAD